MVGRPISCNKEIFSTFQTLKKQTKTLYAAKRSRSKIFIDILACVEA
jgi:hypothetical protein